LTQQEFLDDAMAKLAMTRPQFAARLGCTENTLRAWLLPSSSKEFRVMEEGIWKFVREVLEHSQIPRGQQGSAGITR
jgi:aspartate carbamoyltransferase catalytic subunit